MTPKFDNFIHFFLEATSFTTLPDDPPHGFWIAPNGDFFPVKFQKHMEVGFQIAKDYLKIPDDKISSDTLYTELGKRKFVRVVKDDFSSRVFLADTFYYQYAGYFGDTDDSPYVKVPFDLTNSSKRTINDIGAHYQYRIIYNNA